MSLNTTMKIALGKRRLAAIGNPIKRYSLGWYVDMLKAGRPFSFARYGDGEWSALLGRQGKNCDGHDYFPALGEELRQALLHPLPYCYAMQPRAIKTEGREICDFLSKNHIRIPWHDSDVFHTANGAGRLYPLVQQLRSMKVVLVGPPYLRQVRPAVFEYARFIEVPASNCYEKKDAVRQQILSYASSSAPAVIAFSASMMANVIIHELFPVLGPAHWLLDFGSLWDVYAGVQSRLYFNKGDWAKKTKKNLGVS
jgi:hypothetical protein